jgi:heme exporter protein B
MKADEAGRLPEQRAPEPGFLRQTALVLGKDLRIELATGEVITTTGFFAVLVVVLASMSFYGGPETRRLVAAGALWLAIAFSTVLAVGRSWYRERQDGALQGLLAAPLARSALFAGKALGLALFLAVIELVVVPLGMLFFTLELGDTVEILAIALLATPGIAATATLFGAMTVRTRVRDLVLSIVLFPLLAPTLVTAVTATRSVLGGTPLFELGSHLALILVFDAVFLAGGLGLFGELIES